MLPRNLRQEALSRAYVRAIAARAGAVCVEATQDFGIDFYLRAVTFQAGRYSDTGPELDVQLKSTTRAEMSDTEVIHWRPRPLKPVELSFTLTPSGMA